MRISDWSSDVCSSDLPVKECFDMAIEQGRATVDRVVMITGAKQGAIEPIEPARIPINDLSYRFMVGEGIAHFGSLIRLCALSGALVLENDADRLKRKASII